MLHPTLAGESLEQPYDGAAFLRQALPVRAQLVGGQVVAPGSQGALGGVEREPPAADQRVEVDGVCEHAPSVDYADGGATFDGARRRTR